MGTLADRAELEATAPPPLSPKQIIARLLEQNAGAIADSLPEGMSEKRFRRLLLTATVTNPDLLECDPYTFLRAGVLSAQLALEPNDPREEAFLVAIRDRSNRYGKVVDFRIGWRGLAKLAYNAGASPIIPQPVFPGDMFEYQLGTKPRILHRPDPNADGYWSAKDLVAVYAVSEVRGKALSVVLYRKQVEEHRMLSPAKDSGPWRSHYIAMARKTAVRELCKYLPQSAELAKAVVADERGIDAPELDLPALEQPPVPGAVDADAIEADSWTVDTETGEMLEAEEITADDAAEIDVLYDPDDPGRPF